MSQKIDFNGFGHFPKGNAEIEIVNNQMIISNLKDSSDGVIINTNGVSGMEISMQPHEIKPDEVFGATFNIKDGMGRMKTMAQWAITPNKDGKYAFLMVNSRLEGKNIQVIGMKDEKVVYVQNILNTPCCCDPNSNWIVVAVFVLAAVSVVLANVDYKKETVEKKDKDGNVIGTEEKVTKSFGGGSVVQPVKTSAATPTPTGYDSPIEVDHIYVVSSREYQKELPKELTGEMEEIIFTSNTQNTIVITEEKVIEQEPFKEIDFIDENK